MLTENQETRPSPRKTVPAGFVLQGAVLLAILIAGLYHPALHGPFLYSDEDRIFGYWTVDDMALTTADPYGATGSELEVREASDETSALRPPVIMYAMRAVYPVFKDRAASYHALAMALHFVNCVLVFIVFLQVMSLGPPERGEPDQARIMRAVAAFAGAVLFAVHPAAGVSAAWLTALPQILAATLILGSMALFLHNERMAIPSMGAAYLVSIGVFGMALLACPDAILWFLVPAAAAFCTRRPGERLLQPVARSLPFLALAGVAVILYISWKAYGGPDGPGHWDAAALFTLVGSYAHAIVLVSELPPVQPSVMAGVWTPLATGGAITVIVLALVLAAGIMRRAWPALCVAAAWFLAAAVPHALVAQPFMADPRPYLAYAAPALLAALAMRAAVAPHGALSRKTLLPVAAAFLLLAFFLIGATRTLIPVYRSATAFWSRLAEDTNRRNPLVLYQLSVASVWENNYSTAASALEEAFKATNPEKHRDIRIKLANAMFILGVKRYHYFPDKYLEAESYLLKSIDMDPYNPLPYSTMASIFMDTSKNYQYAYIDILIAIGLAADKEPMERARRHIMDSARKDGIVIDFKEARRRADIWLRTIGVLEDPESAPQNPGTGTTPRPAQQDGKTPSG